MLFCVFFASCVNEPSVKPPPDTDIDIDIDIDVPDDTLTQLFLGNPPVLINEVNSMNVDYADEFGNMSGWVEFYNPADTAVNLAGYYLTNSAGRRLFQFGNVLVEGRGYLTVFLSGRNRPDLDMTGGGIDLIAEAIGAWYWAGGSPTAEDNSTASRTFVPNTSIGGTLIANNSSTASDAWATSMVMLVLNNWDSPDVTPPIFNVLDISSANRVLLRGYLSAGVRLDIRFAQVGTDDWRSYGMTITGTGIENDLYTIPLPPHNPGGLPDLEKIYGVRFANAPGTLRDSIVFNFTSITAEVRGQVHAPFELNRNGGRLFLLDSIGHIRDSIAYPAGMRGLSYAKRVDNGRWALSKPPTPGAANNSTFYDGQTPGIPATSLMASGHYAERFSLTLPAGTDGSVIHCDTTGRMPSETSAIRSGSTLEITRTTIMRCAQFREGYLASDPILRTYIVGRLPDLPIVSIAVDPVEMFDPVVGLYMPGPNASPDIPHFGANFHANTEIPIHIEFFESGAASAAWNHPAGLRMFGGWSRMHPKKSVAINFRAEYGQNVLKYPLLPEYPHLTRFKRFILRNNGNNFPHDYIRCMLMTSLTEGLDIDYQKGRAVVVYYNGQYFGIHNLRERSNAHAIETNYGIDRDLVDLVDGYNRVRRGSDADYQDFLTWLEGRPSPLSDDDLRIVEQRINLDNYTNYIQAQVYYINKDWPVNNNKRWRSTALPDKRWRWFLYDTDHGWGGYGIWHSPHVPMLNFITATRSSDPTRLDWPNPPHSTYLNRRLFENQSYRNAFVNRFSLMIATYYAPARVSARINALMAPIESEIPHDRARFPRSLDGLQTIRDVGNSRPAQMQREIENFFNLSGGVNITVASAGNGKVFVDGLQIPDFSNGSATFRAYPTVPMVLRAEPAATFTGWSDGITDAVRTVTVAEGMRLEARFGAASF